MASKAKEASPVAKRERVVVSQSDVPSVSLEKATQVAACLWDNYAGKSAAPHDVAIAIDISPTSSTWRVISGAAVAYGLVTGAYNAKDMALTDLGKRLVAPLQEGDDLLARAEAALKPKLLREFFSRYDSAKFPNDDVARNVLVSLGLPRERAETGLSLVKENGRYAGLIREIKSGLFVTLRPTGAPLATTTPDDTGLGGGAAVEVDDISPSTHISPFVPSVKSAPIEALAVRRVFITHGKNARILEQIKEIVRYGKFDPVVAVDHETVSKPVPDKVMEDMRSCQAAIIHVAQEGVLADEKGNLIPQINGNVLIEIGAAMALYGRKFILLVEDGVKLPSNLQGLY